MTTAVAAKRSAVVAPKLLPIVPQSPVIVAKPKVATTTFEASASVSQPVVTAAPHQARTTKLFQELYGRAPTATEIARAEDGVNKVVAGGGTVDQAFAFYGGVMRNNDEYKKAHPFGPWVDQLFQQGVGRYPTAAELANNEKYAKDQGAKGKHIFQIGAELTFFMRLSPEFKKHNPLLPVFDKVYQDNLLRGPNLEEISKLTNFTNKLAKEGKSFPDLVNATNWVVKSSDEYKKLSAFFAAVAANQAAQAQGSRTDTAYINGRPQQISLASVGNGQYMRADAANGFLRMQADARRAGINLSATSGFRTMAQQQELYRRYLNGTGNLAARPGYSNHQGGISMDIGGVGGYGSAAYNWLRANAGRYGFANDVGGEPWHWTFRG